MTMVFIYQKEPPHKVLTNTQIVHGMRSLGKGYVLLEQFSTLMNMPRTMTKTNFIATNDRIIAAVTTVEKKTMSDAAEEATKITSSKDSGFSRWCLAA